MGNELVLLNLILICIALLFIGYVLLVQQKEFRLLRKQNELLETRKEDESLPILNFYNGKAHGSGIVSIKLKNTGKKINNINFISRSEKIDIRCTGTSLSKDEDITLSFVPDGFDISDKYFNSSDLTYSIRYKTVLNEEKLEHFRMKDPGSVFKIDSI